jgi:hypothetical protein
MGKSTLTPPKTNIIYLYLVVLVRYGNHILDYLAYFIIIFD